MKNKKESNLTPEQKEKKDIEWENNVLKVLLPSVGCAAFIIGLVGFILTIGYNVGIAIFLLILCLIGSGGVAYGVFLIIKIRKNKYRKHETIPSEEPNDKQVK